MDLSFIDKASCRELKIVPNSLNTSEVLFGVFPYLEELVICKGCCNRATFLTLDSGSSHLRVLRIEEECFNSSQGGPRVVSVKGLPVLESVSIGRRCFMFFERVEVVGCPQLKTVCIGEGGEGVSSLLQGEEKDYCFRSASECVIRGVREAVM